MDFKDIYRLCGGNGAIAEACNVIRPTSGLWMKKRTLPMTEWTGHTQYALRISELASFMGNEVHPLDVCPGAGQYMVDPRDVEKFKDKPE